MNGWLIPLMLSLAFVSHDGAAKRLGSDNPVAQNSPGVALSVGAPHVGKSGSSGSDARNGANQAIPATTATGSPAATSRWSGVVGGLAAGLGLTWVASSLGLGEGFGQFLLWGVVAAVLAVALGGVWRVRRGAFTRGRVGLAFQGAGEAAPLRTYSPNNVGNDSSARPWERNTTGFDVGSGKRLEEVPQGGAGVGIASVPVGFDVEGFLTASKVNFVSLQAAWDRSDMVTLRAMMTDGMLSQIKVQLVERERDTGGKQVLSEVVMLDARLLGVEQTADGDVASVEFSGLVREDPSAGPSPFREVWNITRPASGASGWLVAGVQALQ
jgi:predicted lipid-binding transport protein (Tim44 family)